jgi:glycosyltransferase involved in cell wall biosynthesis
MLFEAIDQSSAIAKVAMAGVNVALDAGFKVTVVAHQLHESLKQRVEWLYLQRPSRGFALQWLTARRHFKKALGNRKFDVVHAHQPQVADLSDVFQCHFLTRVAYERNCLEERRSLRARLVRAQQQVVLYAEDYFYRNWNPNTLMLFDSDLTRQEFGRLYGIPPKQNVLLYPAPPPSVPTAEERAAARRRLLGENFEGPVVGFLGGIQERKGYRRLIEGLKGERDVMLLLGGSYTEGYQIPELAGHYRCIGSVKETDSFYAACDVLAVPSLFEPFGLVVLEAAARGLPVIATAEVGALPHLLEYDAGVFWRPSTPLAPLVRELTARRSHYLQTTRAFVDALSPGKFSQRLLEVYESVIRGRAGAPATESASMNRNESEAVVR